MEDITPLLTALEESESEVFVPHKACLCGELINIEDSSKIHYSGVVDYAEAICKSCRSEMVGMCRVVCLGCNTLCMYLKPSKDSITGFSFVAGAHYHTKECPRCEPQLTHTSILEKRRWMLERNIPDKADMDILQEIEKKDLEAEKESVDFVKSLTL